MKGATLIVIRPMDRKMMKMESEDAGLGGCIEEENEKKKSFDRSYERDVAGEKALQDGDHYKFWHYKFYGYIKL